MASVKYQVYRYRWVAILAYCLVWFIAQPIWLAFAPISSTVRQAFFLTGVSEAAITLLVIISLIAEIIVSIPIGVLVDKRGWVFCTGAGAILTTFVGIVRVFSPDINWLLLFQFLQGVAMAFIFVSLTKAAVNWFPSGERALAQGLGMFANNLGMVVGLIVTPLLISMFGEYAPRTSLQNALLVYGVVAAIITVVFFVIAREAPELPPEPWEETKPVPLREGLSRIAGSRDYWLLASAFFLGFGIYIFLTDFIERIAWSNAPLIQKLIELYISMYAPQYSFIFIRLEQTTGGLVSGVITLTGSVGMLLIPWFSDRVQRRKPFLLALPIVCIPMVYLLGTQSGNVLLISAAVFGFFLLALAPVLFETMVELKAVGPMLAGLGLGIMLTIGHLGSAVLPLVGGVFQESSFSYIIAELFYNHVILASYLSSVIMNPIYYYLIAPPPLIQMPGTFFGAAVFFTILMAIIPLLAAFVRETGKAAREK
ncbi:MAG: MFS transporter [Candidatus Freyarchaeota archaeon]|nr:MFS transporter [Candidatus Jordarchaeia archaeon]MBS7279138.1 MFS transporter [Candidatus Jordarchaeia archaeon]